MDLSFSTLWVSATADRDTGGSRSNTSHWQDAFTLSSGSPAQFSKPGGDCWWERRVVSGWSREKVIIRFIGRWVRVYLIASWCVIWEGQISNSFLTHRPSSSLSRSSSSSLRWRSFPFSACSLSKSLRLFRPFVPPGVPSLSIPFSPLLLRCSIRECDCEGVDGGAMSETDLSQSSDAVELMDNCDSDASNCGAGWLSEEEESFVIGFLPEVECDL